MLRGEKEAAESEVDELQSRNAQLETQIETLRRQLAQFRGQLDKGNTTFLQNRELIMQLESKTVQQEKFNETLNGVINKKDKVCLFIVEVLTVYCIKSIRLVVHQSLL